MSLFNKGLFARFTVSILFFYDFPFVFVSRGLVGTIQCHIIKTILETVEFICRSVHIHNFSLSTQI